jgi:hypothetical protein
MNMLKFDSKHPSGAIVTVHVNPAQIVAVSPSDAGKDERRAVLILGNGTAIKVQETVGMVLGRLAGA